MNDGNQPHDGIRAEFLDDSHGRHAQHPVDDVHDAIEGADIRLDDGGVHSAALHRDGDVVVGTVSGKVQPAVTISRLDLNNDRNENGDSS